MLSKALIAEEHEKGLHKAVVVVGCHVCEAKMNEQELYYATKEKKNSGSIEEWWFEQAQLELDRTIPKAKEYGSGDLAVMASALRLLHSSKLSVAWGDSFYMEWACAFYALGKVSRVIAAYARGDLPDSDSWFDLGVYCRMAQRIRATGGWEV